MESPADRPIDAPEEDRLGRLRLTEVLGDLVVDAPIDQDGYVIGLGGRWGSGKTSLLNLITHRVQRRDPGALLVSFNPWLFSDAEELVVRFCLELGAQLQEAGAGSAARRAGQKLVRLGRLVAPLSSLPGVGVPLKFVETAGKLVEAADPAKQPSAQTVHGEVRQVLVDLGRRVVVVVDDIDRLTDAEIRELARVIKVVGDLPRVVYLLAYDRERVERALASGGEARDGRAYLEKIVQVAHDVPDASALDLRTMTLSGLRALAAHLELPPDEAGRWIGPLWPLLGLHLRTARDVRRLLNVLPVTLRLLGDEVDRMDAVALEALRMFDFDGWRQLPELAGALGSLPVLVDLDEVPDRQGRLERFCTEESARAAARTRLLQVLFPIGAAARAGLREDVVAELRGQGPGWRRHARVALRHNLMLYLSQARPDGGLPRSTVAEAVALLAAEQPLGELAESVAEHQVGELLVALRDRADELPATALGHLVVELTRLVDQEGVERSESFGPMGEDFDLIEVLGAVASRVRDDEERSHVLYQAAGRCSLSGAWTVVAGLGTPESREGEGGRPPLINLALSRQLRGDLGKRVREADSAELAEQSRLRRLVAILLAAEDGPARLRALAQDDRFLVALLSAMAGEWRPGSRDYALPWRQITALLEDDLRMRVEQLFAAGAGRTQRESAVLLQATRYAAGEPLTDVSPEE